MSRFITPRTVRLALSPTEWIDIREALTAGEARVMFDALYRRSPAGLLETVPFQAQPATLAAYLLEWNLTDDEGRPVTIAGLDAATRARVLDGLDPHTFTAIFQLIEAHNDARAAAREKSSTPRGSDPTSDSRG